jgi:hypothetical protein
MRKLSEWHYYILNEDIYFFSSAVLFEDNICPPLEFDKFRTLIVVNERLRTSRRNSSCCRTRPLNITPGVWRRSRCARLWPTQGMLRHSAPDPCLSYKHRWSCCREKSWEDARLQSLTQMQDTSRFSIWSQRWGTPETEEDCREGNCALQNELEESETV